MTFQCVWVSLILADTVVATSVAEEGLDFPVCLFLSRFNNCLN